MNDDILVLRCLQMAKGSKQKKEIININRDSECFRKLLYYSLNPLLTYNVSEKTLNDGVVREGHQYNSFFDICDDLSSRRGVDDYTLSLVRGFLSEQDDDDAELYSQILSKTLKLGVTGKSVNAVIPGLIPEWEIQQAYPIDKRFPAQDEWFALTEKLNGVRATYYRGKLCARSGDEHKGMDHITRVLDAIGPDMVFDGELTLVDKGNLSDNESFRKATGIINADVGAVDKTTISYTIFDVLPASEFDLGTSNATYRNRRRLLDEIYAPKFDGVFVKVLPTEYMGTDQSMIPALLDKMVREDKEGLMLNYDAPYKCKRHNGILKIKRFYTMDLPIVGCEEGSGRLKGCLGAFVLDFKGNSVRVGSGFTDQERVSFWDRRESIVGTLCEVKYKEVSKDKNTGAESLQFPVFVSLREDKTEPSYG